MPIIMLDNPSTEEDNSRSVSFTHSPSGKRKRDPQQPSLNPKAPRKKRQKKGETVEDPDIDHERGINSALGRLDRHLLADYLSNKTKQFNHSLSLVELEEKRIPGIYSPPKFKTICIMVSANSSYTAQAIHDTSEWRKKRVLENLPGFLDQHASQREGSKNLSTASKIKGAPHTIVVAAAGLRAADITRYVGSYILRPIVLICGLSALRTYETTNAVVAKLFAKHIKLGDAIEYVKRTRYVPKIFNSGNACVPADTAKDRDWCGDA